MRSLTVDIEPLLPVGVRFREDDAVAALENIWITLIARIKVILGSRPRHLGTAAREVPQPIESLRIHGAYAAPLNAIAPPCKNNSCLWPVSFSPFGPTVRFALVDLASITHLFMQ